MTLSTHIACKVSRNGGVRLCPLRLAASLLAISLTLSASVAHAVQEQPSADAAKGGADTADDSNGQEETVAVHANAAETEAPADDPNKQVLKDISFDNLKFEMETGTPFRRELLTEEVKKLDGQLIKIRGYMKPNFQQSNIEKFVLVRDNQACCFGPGAAIYDCVLVMLAAGKATDFSVRPITVTGTMYLKEYKGPDGNIWAIFRMKNAAVE